MASKHESIKWTVIEDWTILQRGRLYCSSQGMAIPWEPFKEALYQGIPAIKKLNPIWFGPLKRKYKGFPDVFGYELVNGIPVFCTVEVKTKNDIVKPNQKKVMNWLSSQGVRCYVALEEDSEKGYRLERWK